MASQATRLWSDRRLRLAVAAIAFAGLTALTYLIAHPRMFSGFMGYDDEGYMLTALKSFVNHGGLYDEVFTQYGPFYYEAWGGLFSLFGIPVTHDAGRAVTMVAWIVSSLAIGLATMRIAGSLLLGLATQALVFTALGVAVNEPMHPGGIICLLLAAIVVIACFVSERPSPYAMAALGGTIAALILVKINVGFFALAALALACTVSYPLLDRRWLRPLVEAGFVGLPLLLMLAKFDEAWARKYAVHVAIAALAVVIVLRARESERRPAEELGWLLGGLVAVAIVVCVAIVGAGTSVDGLVEGVLRQPLRQADAFTIPMFLSSRFYGVDLVALGAALAYWYVARRRSGPPQGAWLAVISLFSLLVGLAMAPAVAGKTFPFDPNGFAGYPLSMLAFCWVGLMAAPAGGPRGVAFARLLLPLLAVLQALHAYPVAGSQTLWASFLMIPVGAICVANGARGLYASLGERSERRALVGVACVAGLVLGWFVVNATLREPAQAARGGYNSSVPLALPGSDEIRLSQPEAEMYQQITAAIDAHCPALMMLPGMDSFYLWTEQEPPTITATGWPTLFDDARQQRAIADTRGIEGLCLLRNIPIAAGWGGGEIPPGPLVSYLERGFKPLATFGDYELLQR